MSNLKNTFLRILKENPELERSAMESDLDDGIDATEFDIDMSDTGAPDEVAVAVTRRNQRDLADIQQWIDQTSQWLEILNGDGPNSIQTKLANAVPDTIMDKIKTGQQNKIAKIASDLASFHQALLGYKAQSSRSQLRGV